MDEKIKYKKTDKVSYILPKVRRSKLSEKQKREFLIRYGLLDDLTAEEEILFNLPKYNSDRLAYLNAPKV